MYTSSAVSWAVPAGDVLIQPQPGEQSGMGLGENRASMDTSSSSVRTSTTNGPDDDQEGLASKRLRLVGGLDVDIRGAMSATTCA